MKPLKGLLNLGVWFWLLLPLLGALFWFGSGWITEQQLQQSIPSSDNIPIKVTK